MRWRPSLCAKLVIKFVGLMLAAVLITMGRSQFALARNELRGKISSVKSNVAMFCEYIKRVSFDLNSWSGHKNPNVICCI
jgi:hypothetical protein